MACAGAILRKLTKSQWKSLAFLPFCGIILSRGEIMPELPEVETVKTTLKSQIVGRKIKEVRIYHEKMIKDIPIANFKTQLLNQRFNDVGRRGKYLIFQLDDYSMLSHLRMEGKFFYDEQDTARSKHTHVEFLLDNGACLKYEDVRKFGTFHLYEKSVDLESTRSFSVLGPEPWDERFNIDTVATYFHWKKTPIKSMLLSQKVVAGLGNIYVDEVLFSSGIHPERPSGELTQDEIAKIIYNTKEILAKAIEFKGTTIRTFSSTHGESGKFQNFLQVHTKKDEPCPECCANILKIKVGGRGTYFCPVCQPISEV